MPDQDAHETAFVARLETLRAYARRHVGDQPARVDDLLQDAFVHFTMARPDLTAIANLDGYLTTLVRNLHVSWLRRKANRQQLHVSIESYDSADFALGLHEPELRAVARDGLKRVVQYVCLRKSSAKLASILALRFFHGFYRAEIARMLVMPDRVIDRWLWQARQEARRFVDSRHAPSPSGPGLDESSLPWPSAIPDDPLEMTAALRTALYSTRQPPCLTTVHFARANGAQRPPFDARALSHLVSCPTCLARARASLEIPSSGDRDPSDPAGRGPIDPPDPASTARTFRTAARRRRRDVLEHRPKELCVSVNGLRVGDIAIAAAQTRVRWTVRLDEPLAFAEIHSEQGARVALLTIVPAPEGELHQVAIVEMTDGRRVVLGIDFAVAHPAICVEYIDPLLAPANPEDRAEASTFDAARSPTNLGVSPAVTPARDLHRDVEPRPRWPWSLLRLRWLVPALGVALLISLTFWTRRGIDVASNATAVLEQAVSAETASPIEATSAAHRTLRLTMQDTRSGLVSSHRIETWTVGSDRRRATRVLDMAGHVVAGEWVDAQGRTTTRPLGSFDTVWQAALTAATFRESYIADSRCIVEPAQAVLTIRCERVNRASLWGVVYPVLFAMVDSRAVQPSLAVLVLRRHDLHAVQIMLTVRDGDIDRSITLEEEALRHLPLSDVPAEALRPDTLPTPPAASTTLLRPIRASTASRSTEMHVLEIVDRLVDEGQVSVVRSARGALSVEGLVSSAETKRALHRALAAIDPDGVVQSMVLTYREAAARDAQRRSRRAGVPTRVEVHEVPAGLPPIATYLHARDRTLTNAEILRLADRVVVASRRARLHASAIVPVIDRFPEAVVDELSPDAREAWWTLVRRRLTSCVEALKELDVELVPHVPENTNAAPAAAGSVGAVAQRLQLELITIDEAIVGAFVPAPGAIDDALSLGALDLRTHIARAIADAELVLHTLEP